MGRASVAVVAAGLIFATLVGSASISASTDVAKRTLVVAVTGQGKVASSPKGISCPTKCRANFRIRALVRLAAHPSTGWKFSRWIGACSTAGACAIRLKSSKAVRAVFARVPVPKPPPPPPPGSTRDNPLPLGQAVGITVGGTEQWQFRILSVDPDATAKVLAENQFNDPPQPGFQFFMAAVQVNYVSGAIPRDPYFRIASDLKAVGNSNVSYTQFSPGCGVTPDDLLLKATDLFPGGAIVGNICWSVRSSDAASLVSYFEFSNGLFWMALR